MDEWLTSHESAKYLGYNYFHFMREIKTAPGFPKPSRRKTAKGFGHIQYRKSDLDNWRDSNIKAA